MTAPETVTQDEPARLQAEVPESARRFIYAQAVMAGKTMGEYILALLLAHTDYKPPETGAGPAQSQGI